MAVYDALRQPELGPAQDARFFKIERRHAGHVAREEEVEAFVVNESAVLNCVVAGAQRVLDALRGAAVAGDL